MKLQQQVILLATILGLNLAVKSTDIKLYNNKEGKRFYTPSEFYCDELAPCLNGGTCLGNLEEGFRCACNQGYVGIMCELVDACVTLPCQNGGTCVSGTATNYKCQCGPDYGGDRCQYDLIAETERLWRTLEPRATEVGVKTYQEGTCYCEDTVLYRLRVYVNDTTRSITYPPCSDKGGSIHGIQIIDETFENDESSVIRTSGGVSQDQVAFNFTSPLLPTEWTLYIYGRLFS